MLEVIFEKWTYDLTNLSESGHGPMVSGLSYRPAVTFIVAVQQFLKNTGFTNSRFQAPNISHLYTITLTNLFCFVCPSILIFART